MRPRSTGPVLLLGALIGLAACDDRRDSPTGPSAVGPAAIPAAIAISGQTSISEPGATTQLTAIVTFSDGSTKDVTYSAMWGTLSEDALQVTTGGLVTAVRYGTGRVTVSYIGKSAQVSIRVAPPDSFLLTGVVKTDTGFALSGTAVTASSRTGTLSTTSGTSGIYAIPASGDAVVEVSQAGFETLTTQVTVTGDDRLDLVLQRADETGLSGLYSVTFTASSSCQLPPEAMQRTYQARIEEVPPALFVIALGGQFVAWAGETGFTGTRAGSSVVFTIRGTIDDGFNLIERIPSIGDLHFDGTATGTIGPDGISTTFSGTLSLGPALLPSLNTPCTANDHRLMLVRATGAGTPLGAVAVWRR